MGFELRTTSDLIQIVRAGGGITMDAGLRTTSDLIQIARAANLSGAKVVFRKMSLRTVADLIQIARAGNGNVTFES